MNQKLNDFYKKTCFSKGDVVSYFGYFSKQKEIISQAHKHFHLLLLIVEAKLETILKAEGLESDFNFR